MKYAGLPCAFEIGRDYVYMVNGFAAQVLRLDLKGNVLAATGKPGKGPDEFGEAHFIAVEPEGRTVRGGQRQRQPAEDTSASRPELVAQASRPVRAAWRPALAKQARQHV